MRLHKIVIVFIALFVVFACAKVAWQSIEKHFRKKTPVICFMKGSKIVLEKRCTPQEAMDILKNNKDKYDICTNPDEE